MVKKILVDGIMHLGDMMISASVFPILRKHYPNAEIVYLTTANLAPAAALIEGVDRVIPYEYKSGGGVKGVWDMARKLRKEQFDIGISLDPRERVTLMKWLAGIPLRVTLEEALGWQLKWERWFYHQDISLSGWDVRNHLMSESFQEAMRRFCHDDDRNFLRPKLKPSDANTKLKVKQLISDAHVCGGGTVVFCVSTTGDNRKKDWPIERFAELADRLAENGTRLVFIGIREHQERIEKIVAQMRHPEATLNVAGRTSLAELVELLRQVDILISLDTGTAHFAALAGCGVLTIFSFNSPEVYGAAAKFSRAVRAHVPCSGKYVCTDPGNCDKDDCYRLITVDMVYDAAKKLLSEVKR